MRYAVLFEKADTGYSAHVPDLRGCMAAGSTLEETSELIRGAIPEAETIAEYRRRMSL
jgi:predicted RNase H-like HicB family nuclease